jgi:hypothetical protein
MMYELKDDLTNFIYVKLDNGKTKCLGSIVPVLRLRDDSDIQQRKCIIEVSIADCITWERMAESLRERVPEGHLPEMRRAWEKFWRDKGISIGQLPPKFIRPPWDPRP